MSTILITGANRGIGLELARQYANGGWTVLACCRSPEKADELNTLAAGFRDRDDAEADAKADGGIRVYPLDVRDAAQRAALAAGLEGHPIDILCNNAAISGDWDAQGFGGCQADPWLAVLHTNVIAPMLMTQDFVENVAASPRRLIVNMSSRLGSFPNAFDDCYFYCSSKAALNKVTLSCARDLARRGITVVALHPGWVRTDMGGPNAALSVAASVVALRKNLAGITLSDSGRFMDMDGTTIPW